MSNTVYLGTGSSAYFLTNVTAMQIDLMSNGPIVAGYTVYTDFIRYKKGKYCLLLAVYMCH